MRHSLGLMTSHHKCSNLLGPISPVLRAARSSEPFLVSWELSQGAMTQGLSRPGESHICNPLAIRTVAACSQLSLRRGPGSTPVSWDT